MKNILFAFLILSPFAAISQFLLDVGAGLSTSSPFLNIKAGYIDGSDEGTMYGLQGTAHLFKSDKALLLTGQVGYNAWLGEKWRMVWSGGGGYLNHNSIKAKGHNSSQPVYKGFVPILSTSFDYHFSRIGAVSISGFSALRVHGISLSIKCYIDK